MKNLLDDSDGLGSKICADNPKLKIEKNSLRSNSERNFFFSSDGSADTEQIELAICEYFSEHEYSISSKGKNSSLHLWYKKELMGTAVITNASSHKGNVANQGIHLTISSYQDLHNY